MEEQKKQMEELMENMVYINEALRVKDEMLERHKAEVAEAQASAKEQLLQEPSPRPQTYKNENLYQDKDVYMGDNEEQSGLRKAMRKARKARCVETEDEDMENETDGETQKARAKEQLLQESQSGSRKAMQKDKGKARQVENEHEVENSEVETP